MPTVGVDVWPSAWGGLTGGTQTHPGAPLFPRYDEDQQRVLLERLGVADALPAAKASGGTKPASTRAAEKLVTPEKQESTEKTMSETTTAAAAPSPPTPAVAPAPSDGLATIDDLSKIALRLALVREAERVPKSDKLLRLQVDVGEGAPRQILAGIGKVYAPEDLIGKRIVVIANLAPRKMMGLESRGMVLAAGDGETLSVLSVDKELPPGAVVK